MFEKRPPLKSPDPVFKGGVFFQTFSAAFGGQIFTQIVRVPPYDFDDFFIRLEKRPPLKNSDPIFKGGVFFQRGGLFSNISPDTLQLCYREETQTDLLSGREVVLAGSVTTPVRSSTDGDITKQTPTVLPRGDPDSASEDIA